MRQLWRLVAASALGLAAAACGGGSGVSPGRDGGSGGSAVTGDASGGLDTAGATGGISGGEPGTDAASDGNAPELATEVAPIDAPPPGPGDATAATDVDFRLSTLTMEALQVAGTHNSYHQAPVIPFDASHAYTHKPLDQQLTGGVRGLELDLHLGNGGAFEIYHIALIDPNSSCKTLDECLGIIATWSTSHPRHVPIFVWFELKDDTGGMPIKDVVPVEAVILKAFARERIITPAWLRGNYASPRERLMTVGWPTIDDARGKIMFTLITHDARTKAYAHDGTSLDDRLMWVNAVPDEFGLPWTVITKDQDQPDVIARAHAAHLLLGLNVCAVNMTDDACTARLKQTSEAGVHLLQDDLPFQISGRKYWLQLPKGSPGCNPVTAPLTCDATKLE